MNLKNLPQQLLVRATQTGYHEHGRRRTGTEFMMDTKDIKFDPKTGYILKPTWVELCEQPDAPVKPRGPVSMKTGPGNAAVSRPANGVTSVLPNPAPKQQPQGDAGADAGDQEDSGTESDANKDVI